jgi:hypothetical protein
MKGWDFPKVQQLIANHIKSRSALLFQGFLCKSPLQANSSSVDQRNGD